MKSSSYQRAITLILNLSLGLISLQLPGPNSIVMGVGARSILDIVPGADLVRDLANDAANRLGRVLKNDIIRPIRNNLSHCLSRACHSPSDPDASRNVAEIIRSRGFEAEEHDVITRDGYILTIQRIINPLIDPDKRKTLKPVILQHGLLWSSVDWVINSLDVRPQKYPRESGTSETTTTDSQKHPNALGFYLANEGYDVFLANSRGNVYGQRHVNMSSWNPKFWAFTFDEQIKYDLPDTTRYIQQLTGHTKLGYVGYSQGTLMMFGLLSDQPDYADVFEPVVMLAPSAYVSNSISPVKYFAIYTPLFERVNMWFGNSNAAVRYLAQIVCKPDLIKSKVCANLVFLSTGFDAEQLDMKRASAYMAHMPSGTSVKNLAHYGQEVLSGRFAHFDHGIQGNQAKYGQAEAPDYDLSKIRSKSLVFFTAENDWMASPKNVAKLMADLTVTPFQVHSITESKPKWNHIDFVYGKDCGQLVNKRIIEAFHHFDQ